MNPVRILTLGAVALLTGSVVWAVTRSPDSGRRLEPSRQYRAPTFQEIRGKLNDAVRESSGIATSRRHDGVFWTHNDSGGEPLLLAVTIRGEDRGVLRLLGADLVDWEDMALGTCPSSIDAGDDRDCIYIADTGDNARRRDSVDLYVIPEPDLPRNLQGIFTPISGVRRFTFSYPDGHFDVEAMAVAPSGLVYLVSKGRSDHPRVYTLLPALNRRPEPALLQSLELAPSKNLGRMVTAAAISPSGRRFVVKTYTELYYYTIGPDGELINDGEPCFYGFVQPGGEAVDFLDEEMLVMTSEAVLGGQGTILVMSCD